MSKKEHRGSGRTCWGFLTGIVLLTFLAMNGSAAEVQGGKKTGQQAARQQGEEINFQEGLRASKIIDTSVKNTRGEDLGEVDDLIMSRNGKIKKVILSVGGFLGVGDRLIAVPFKSLQIQEKGTIVYPVTKQQLENHPVFTYKAEGFDQYYYSPPPPYGSFGLAPPGYQGYFPYGYPQGPSPGGRFKGEYGPWGWEYYPDRLRVSGILNRSFWNEAGQDLGEIDDLIIGQNAKAETLILAVGAGAFLESEQKLVALHFKPLKVDGAGIVYKVTRQQLKEFPEFHYEKR